MGCRPPLFVFARRESGQSDAERASASCFQAIVAQGPVAFDYNGAPPTPAVQPISGVTISNCDFGTPVASGAATVTSPGPIYAFNVSAMTLANVTIGGAGRRHVDHGSALIRPVGGASWARDRITRGS
ncbi:hypothetical protein BVI1335_220107 [Burkholderia vietnamiensis]|nr:hypothetical protein BVI1335_220107 [Burkholderia vietnamiensis]